jgi:hypothetical protein
MTGEARISDRQTQARTVASEVVAMILFPGMILLLHDEVAPVIQGISV